MAGIQRGARGRQKFREKFSPESIEARKRQARALELKNQGLLLKDIAAELGVCIATVWNDCKKAYRELPAAGVEEGRRQWNVYYTAMRDELWPRALGGELEAIDRFLKLSREDREMNGWDAPKRAPVNEKGETVADFDPVAILLGRIARIAERQRAGGGAGGTDQGTGGAQSL